MNYLGIQISTDINMTLPAQDWSRVRSPSRAIRRMKRGFRQNIRHYQKPDPRVVRLGNVYYCHPVTLHALQQAAQANASKAA